MGLGTRVRGSPLGVTLEALVRAAPGGAVVGALLLIVNALLAPAGMIATGVLVGAVPAAVAGGAGSAGQRRLLVALVVFGAIFLASIAVSTFSSALTSSLNHRFVLAVQQQLLGTAVSQAGIAHLEDPGVIDEYSVIERESARWGYEETIIGLFAVAGARLSGLASFVLLAGYAWWAPVLLVLGWATTHRWLRREIATFVQADEGHAAPLRRSLYYRDLGSQPASAKEVRIFGLAPWVVDRFAAGFLAAMRSVWRERSSNARRLVETTLALVGTHVVVLAALARDAAAGEVSLTALVVFVQAVMGMYSLGYIGDQESSYRMGAALVKRMVAFERRLASGAASLPGSRSAEGLPRQAIRFEAVSFAYPGTDRLILQDLELLIPQGRSLAIVGLNGAGKTTLTKLLCRLYDPDAGRITVDGIDLRDLGPDAWRKRLGVIFQDFVRYELPARDNVGFGALEVVGDVDRLDRAADRAGASSLIEGLSAGWDTILSRGYEDGTDLSGGQWQRIALARAFAAVEGGSGVLVLDEPTANLDVRAEAELFERFLVITTGLTTILISHRFSTVRRADRICLVEEGRVVEEGSHEELMARRGTYAQMFTLQAERFVGGDVSGA